MKLKIIILFIGLTLWSLPAITKAELPYYQAPATQTADETMYNCFCWYYTDESRSSRFCDSSQKGTLEECEVTCLSLVGIVDADESSDEVIESTDDLERCVYTDETSETSDHCEVSAGSGAYLADYCLNPTRETTSSDDNYVAPILSVNIPTISFSGIAEEGGYLEVNWLGEYITGLYQFLLAVSAIFAVIMMMVAGLQYIYSPGGAEQAAAKKRLTNALTGMVLLFCVYLILFTVNPKMTVFQAISLQVIRPDPYAEEDDVVNGTVATSLGTVSGSNITGAGVNKIPTELISSVEAAAASLEGTGISLSIASSFRSVEKQMALIEQNCQNPAGSATCNPKAGKAPTCILKDLNPAKCPHTTGRALDIWGVQNGRQCVIGDNCLKSGGMAACFSNPCQAAVIRAMKAQGFCSLSTEAWHFEKPKMSTKCN